MNDLKPFFKKTLSLFFATSLILLLCAPPAEPARFVVTGDSRGGDNGVNSTILSEIVQATLHEEADFIVFTGDLVNGSSDPTLFESQLTTWKNILGPLYQAGIGVYPCRGNHDSGNKAVWDRAFSGTYALPQNGPPKEKNITYSFSFENALGIALDEYGFHSEQVNQDWLDLQLARNRQTHIFVFGHLPAFSVYHSGCLDDHPIKRNIFWKSLARAGGMIYFAGHDHLYNHARIDDGDGNEENDLHQYIVGTAGAPPYTWDGSYDGLNAGWTPELIASESAYGYCLVDVKGTEVTVTWKHRTAPGVYETGADQYTHRIEASGSH